MVITVPLIVILLVTIVGLALYLPSLNPKVNRVGEIMFGCGLLVLLLLVARILA